jgi:toxin ParE1/3/4
VKIRPVIPRVLAERDVQEVIDHLAEDSPQAALGFVDALEQAYSHIGRHPAAGSPRYAHELALPGLRFWPVRGYPYLIFYVEQVDRMDVWRVLHSERDIPVWMHQQEEPF